MIVYTGRFPPWSYLRTAVEVERLEDGRMVVETLDGVRHVRNPWSLRLHQRNGASHGVGRGGG